MGQGEHRAFDIPCLVYFLGVLCASVVRFVFAFGQGGDMRGVEALRAQTRADVHLAALPALADGPLHLVGGAVRDALRGEAASDRDIAVPHGAIALARRFAGATGGAFVPLHEGHPTARVVVQDAVYDFAEYRASTLAADLQARDLTINAIAADLQALLAGDDAPLVDPCGGLADLDAGRLQPCGPGVFAADPVRVVRLYRFVATLGMKPTAEAEAQARAVTGRDSGAWWWHAVAPERVADELAKLFAAPHAARAIPLLMDAGLLRAFVPHLDATRGLAQGGNHHLDVYDHDLAAAVAVAGEFLPSLGAWAAPFAGELRDWLAVPTGRGRTRRWLVPFAALIHGLGKATTRATKPDGTNAFPRHPVAGGHLAARIAQSLRLSRAETRLLVRCVRLHGYPDALHGRGREALVRFFAVAGAAAPGAILVAMGDGATARGPKRPPETVAADIAWLQSLVREGFGTYGPLLAAPPLVRGGDLIAALGLAPGRRIGELLLLVRRRQLAGEVRTTEEAIAAARVLLAHRYGADGAPANGM